MVTIVGRGVITSRTVLSPKATRLNQPAVFLLEDTLFSAGRNQRVDIIFMTQRLV